ncbi:MAG TPA: hypothetical protein VIQ99_00440 [Gammaproteobacteria bacterium]
MFRKDGTFVRELLVAPRTRGGGSVWDIAFSKDSEQKYLYLADGGNERVCVTERESLDVLTSFGDGGRQPGSSSACTVSQPTRAATSIRRRRSKESACRDS